MTIEEAEKLAEKCHFILTKDENAEAGQGAWICRCLEYPFALGAQPTPTEAFEDCLDDTVKMILKIEGI